MDHFPGLRELIHLDLTCRDPTGIKNVQVNVHFVIRYDILRLYLRDRLHAIISLEYLDNFLAASHQVAILRQDPVD